MRTLFLFVGLSSSLMGMNLSSLSLKQAEVIALSKNKEILIADEITKQKNLRRTQAISAWLPSLKFTSMVAKLQRPQSLLPNEQETKFAVNQLVLNQPIFSTDLIFGLREANILLKDTEIDSSITTNSILLALREAYFGVVLNKHSLEVQQEVIQYLNAALEDEEKKLHVGKSTPLQVSQIKASLAQAYSIFHSLSKNLKMAKSALVLALGVSPSLENQIEPEEKEIPLQNYPEIQEKLKKLEELQRPGFFMQQNSLALFSNQEIEAWITKAERDRPEVKKSSILIRAAKEEVKARKGHYLPTISAFVDYGYYKPFNGLFFKQQYNMAGGILLNWNIFDSFKREFEIKEAGHARSAAKISFEKQVDFTAIQIRDLLSQMEEALFSHHAAEASLQLAKEALDDTRVRLSAGTAAPLDYKEAIRSYAEASRQLTQSNFDLLIAYFRLRHAAGMDV